MNIKRHGRFYLALIVGGLAFLLAAAASRWEVRVLVGGNAFFLAYIVLSVAFVVRASSDHLKRAAAAADEGLPIILVVAGAAVLVSLGAAAIPLGWLTIHTIVAFHYGNLYYAPQAGGFARGLEFPGDEAEPGPWDFVYFSFVIGMTAQVSDVAVSSSVLRRSVLGHGVLSFFYYTGIVALAVNAASSG